MTVNTATAQSDTVHKGILLLVFATFVFACQDAVTKHLAQTYATPQIIWIRYVFFAVFATIVAGWHVPIKQAVKSTRPVLQVIRSLVILVEIGTFVVAVRVLSLVEIHAIMASFPLIVTAMSAVFLKETVGIRRWAAVLVGFIGILVILRPGLGVFRVEALIALAAAFLFALYQVLTKVAGRTDKSSTSMLYMAVVGAAVLTAIGPFYWIEPTPEAWLWLGVLSVTGVIGHSSLIYALSLAPASSLQPFNYTLLLWATIVGYLVFDNLPDLWTIVGGAIVVASGLYTIYRERRRAVPVPQAVAQVKP